VSAPDGQRSETVVVRARYCGPPDSGNGGYSAGLLGTRLPGTPQVIEQIKAQLDRLVSALLGESGREP